MHINGETIVHSRESKVESTVVYTSRFGTFDDARDAIIRVRKVMGFLPVREYASTINVCATRGHFVATRTIHAAMPTELQDAAAAVAIELQTELLAFFVESFDV